MYLIKWKHWPSNFNTWEPLANLEGCEPAIHEYESRLESKSNTSILPLKRKHSDLSDDESKGGYHSNSDTDSDDSVDDFDVSDQPPKSQEYYVGFGHIACR